MTMKLIRRVKPCSRYSHGYGLVCHDRAANESIVAIIPMNLLLRAGLWLYWLVVRGVCVGHWERKLAQAYNAGSLSVEPKLIRLEHEARRLRDENSRLRKMLA